MGSMSALLLSAALLGAGAPLAPGGLFAATPLTAERSFTAGIEGPAVDGAGNIYAANFGRQQAIGIVTPQGAARQFALLPGASVPNGLRFDRDGTLYVADYVGHNIYRFAPGDATPRLHAHEAAMSQPNDLAITAAGVLYASDPDWEHGTGRVWRIDRDGKVTLVASGLGTANGIEVSPDGRTLYVGESAQRTIQAFTIGADGALSDQRLLRRFDDYGLDGMRVDVDGNLYVSRFGKGTVVKLAPDGALLREIALPGDRPSNLCFGGPDGRTLYVTEVEHQRLLQIRVDRPGLEWRRMREP
ncbi:Sugar lactone lactonase YvrE [Duganella sp. CF517]|uniref:SMP-30/gluconolactonase/LRE family protein n=1 Tax=Duganella sp. CF517 TaxID=1881038 RepID=UPI0008D217DF|nr:SMP-30/gluconolactonase/LRE family protein [Duganella sp. CF517]SEN82385.1 Sugar lactone lactonase YvrE [Duganella sp. CF517]